MKNNLEQLWKEEARKAYQDQQSQDNEGGCRESIGFVQGYLTAKKSDFEEIELLKWQKEEYKKAISEFIEAVKTLKEQLAEAESIIEFYSDDGGRDTEDISAIEKNIMGMIVVIAKGGKLARQYFAEKEKQDKENKDEK